MAAHRTFTLTLMAGHYAVCQLPPAAPIPTWAAAGDFCAITRTQHELSIICRQDSLPDSMPDALTVERGWVLLRVEGAFDFTVTGVLAALSAVLAQAGVVLLAVATYQTDYLLVKSEQLPRAQAALMQAGHKVNSAGTSSR